MSRAVRGRKPARLVVSFVVTCLVAVTWTIDASAATTTERWSTPQTVVPSGDIDGVSCASPRLCVATVSDGDVIIWNGTVWSAPSLLATQRDPDTGDFGPVSCTAPAFCMIQSGPNTSRAFNGSSWSAPLSGTFENSQLSCGTPAFCLAVSDSGTSVWNGTDWSAPSTAGIGGGGWTISCASTSCGAVSSEGQADTWRDGSWSPPTTVGKSTEGVDVVSCSSPDFCAALQQSAAERWAAQWNGSTWASDPSMVTSTVGQLACVSSTFCVAYSGNDASTWDGTSWSPPQMIGPDGGVDAGLSCPTATFCVAVDYDGFAMVMGANASASPPPPLPSPTPPSASALRPMAAGRWGKPVHLYPRPSLDVLVGLSCSATRSCTAVYDGPSCEKGDQPEKNFCVAGNGGASGVSGNGRRWSRPVTILGGGNAIALSCAPGGACAALTDSTVATGSGIRWNAPVTLSLPTSALASALSCASSTFCAVVDDQGGAATYDGRRSSYSSLIDLDSGFEGILAISCASSTFCMAVDDDGQAVAWLGTRWSAPAPADAGDELDAIACPASNYCVALDRQGRVLTWAGKWSGPSAARSGVRLVSLSCPAAGGCVALDHSGQVLTGSASHWSQPRTVDHAGRLVLVSCPTTAWCVAGDDTGHAVTFVGRA
jgi:hypothetical protein